MTRLSFHDGFYGDMTAAGAFAVQIKGGDFQTHLGPIPHPTGDPAGPLYVRCTDVGGFRFAGQSADALNPAAWEWTAEAGWIGLPPPCVGVSPVLYDLRGTLHRSDGSIGSQGYRYAAHDGTPEGRLVSGDQSYGPFHGLFEYSEAGPSLWVGQAAYDGGGVQIWDGATLRQLETGNCRFVRVQYDGETVAITFVRPDATVCYHMTAAELRAQPPVEATIPPEPEPQPPDPEPEPPDPEPIPEPPDPEPVPESPYFSLNEDTMTTEQGWLIGPGDRVASVHADGRVTFDHTDLTDLDLLELTKPDDRYGFRHVASDLWLGADATIHTPTGDVCRQFYAIPERRGNYEAWSVGQWAGSPIVSAVIFYDRQGADHGRPWTSAALTWVKK